MQREQGSGKRGRAAEKRIMRGKWTRSEQHLKKARAGEASERERESERERDRES
jgi:hypothetical protein